MTNRRKIELTKVYQNKTEEELRASHATARQMIAEAISAKSVNVAKDHMEVIERILEGSL